MFIQRLLVALIIGAAAFYLVRSLTRKDKGHTGGACGKCDCGNEHKTEA